MDKRSYAHGKHGWFVSRPKSYGPLLESKSVKLLAQSYPPSTRAPNLYQFQHFLNVNQMGPGEILALSDKEIKMCVRKAILDKNSQGKYEAARRTFYVVRRFLELNDRELQFNRTEKKALLRRVPKRIARQYIPTEDEIYRMADSAPNKGPRQQSRARAIVLCLWQSGVRGGCLCGWLYGMFKNQLYPQVKVPVTIKVVANRPEGVTDCAEDTKLSAYNVLYYYTFLHEEAARALKTYLDEQISDGWQPHDSDPVFVTEGTASKGRPIEVKHLLEVVKNCAEQIRLDPDSIWTHCLRKAFRKTLYRGGVDLDVVEALMGHKLPGSRGSYFDYHDVRFAEAEYLKGFWNRIDTDRIRQLEDEMGELRREKERSKHLEAEVMELKQRLNGLTKPKRTIDVAMTKLLEDPEVQDLLKKKLTEIL